MFTVVTSVFPHGRWLVSVGLLVPRRSLGLGPAGTSVAVCLQFSAPLWVLVAVAYPAPTILPPLLAMVTPWLGQVFT